MKRRNHKMHARYLAYGAIIAAMYAALTHLQNILIPNSASMAVQFRASEALCVLAFFTPAAVPGLTLGCALFNLSFAGALPLDALVGSAATLLATLAMRLARKYPLVALSMPAVFNAILVGWELTAYIGGGFWLNALYVALGELIVLLTFGVFLCRIIQNQHLDSKMFK